MLLLLLLALLLGAAGSFLRGGGMRTAPVVTEAEAVLGVLREARSALLEHALLYADRVPGRMGVLPCPERRSSLLLPPGSAAGTCGARHVDAVGLLPWRSLGLPPPPFCVIYVVSGLFKSGPAAYLLNEDSSGSLRLYDADGRALAGGTGSRRRAAALLLAPRAGRRASDCGDLLDRNRLPGLRLAAPGTDSELQLSVPPGAAAAGDLALALEGEEIFAALHRRPDFATRLHDPAAPGSLARRVAECLVRFADAAAGRLPWPAPLRPADDRRNESYDDQLPPPGLSAARFGRLPDLVDDSLAALGQRNNGRLVTTCGEFAQRRSEARRLWDNWKDHFFYAVAAPYQPDAPPPPPGTCAGCLAVHGESAYAAVLIYSGSALPEQDRGHRRRHRDYLEGANRRAAEQVGAPSLALEARARAAAFNDVLYCIRPPGELPRLLPCPVD